MRTDVVSQILMQTCKLARLAVCWARFPPTLLLPLELFRSEMTTIGIYRNNSSLQATKPTQAVSLSLTATKLVDIRDILDMERRNPPA